MECSLREVQGSDLPIFFEQQLDPEAVRMAAYPPRERDAFMAHWAKVMGNPACNVRTVLFNGSVAGHVCAWTDGPARFAGYWFGREFWGRGIASSALVQFLREETIRPLTACVVKHNAASIRVLLKAGFTPAGGGADEELVFTLG